MNIQEQIKDILHDQFAIEAKDVTGSTCLRKDLDMDSLDVVELVMTLEREYNIRIPDKEFDARTQGLSIDELTAIVQKHIDNGSN